MITLWSAHMYKCSFVQAYLHNSSGTPNGKRENSKNELEIDYLIYLDGLLSLQTAVAAAGVPRPTCSPLIP